MEYSDLISQTEAGRLRGVSRQAISDLVKRGVLPGYQVAGRLLVRRAEVLALAGQLDTRGRPPAPHRRPE